MTTFICEFPVPYTNHYQVLHGETFITSNKSKSDKTEQGNSMTYELQSEKFKESLTLIHTSGLVR